MSPQDDANNGERNAGTSSEEHRPLLPSFTNRSIEPEGESGRSGFHVTHFTKILWRSSSQASQIVNILWPFVPVAFILHYGFPGLGTWIFVVSYIGIVAPANLLGFAGQELARKLPKVAGILIETALGSIVEIVLFLLLIVKHRTSDDNGTSEDGNLIPVIQAAILGSILTNLLLCLGLCFFVGGIRQQSQKFHAAVSEVGTGLLLVAGFGLLIPSAFYSSLKGSILPVTEHSKEGYSEKQLKHDTLKISQFTSIILIVAFFMSVFSLRPFNDIIDFFQLHLVQRPQPRQYF